MSQWRAGQKAAIIEQARARGMLVLPASSLPAAKAAEPEPEKTGNGGGIRRKRAMNKTEAEFSRILEARVRRGEIREWKFEPVRLQIGDGAVYTADFLIRPHEGKPTLIETKGGFIWGRDSVRYKTAKAQWEWLFDFTMWQKRDGEWREY